MDIRLYMAQRLSALVMAPLVIGHLALMIYAVQDGLSASEIIGRTQGSVFWAVFYGVFVLAAAVHASVGVRVIAEEWLGARGPAATGLMLAVFSGLFFGGLNAVVAVISGPV